MSEVHGSVGSYVVNALDSAEKDEFEAHLDTCPTCRREVVEFSETAAQLGSLVETPPPPALRASVLSAIREVRPLPPEVADPPIEWDTDAPLAVSTPPAVDELAVRRARRTSRLLSLAVAAAMVVALGLGGWVVNLVQDRQAQSAEATLEAQLMTAPDVKHYNILLKNGARVAVAVSKSLNKGLLVGKDLPNPGERKQYQLWTLTHGATNAVPDRVFDGGAVQKTWFTSDLKAADGVAVTVQAHGGAQIPSKDVQALVKF